MDRPSLVAHRLCPRLWGVRRWIRSLEKTSNPATWTVQAANHVQYQPEGGTSTRHRPLVLPTIFDCHQTTRPGLEPGTREPKSLVLPITPPGNPIQYSNLSAAFNAPLSTCPKTGATCVCRPRTEGRMGLCFREQAVLVGGAIKTVWSFRRTPGLRRGPFARETRRAKKTAGSLRRKRKKPAICYWGSAFRPLRAETP